VLGEEADLSRLARRTSPPPGTSRPANSFARRGLAVAVGAEQRDAVVGVDAQARAAQHRRPP
jgi:hypothetical protein